jgi:hypothetical protein
MYVAFSGTQHLHVINNLPKIKLKKKLGQRVFGTKLPVQAVLNIHWPWSQLTPASLSLLSPADPLSETR